MSPEDARKKENWEILRKKQFDDIIDFIKKMKIDMMKKH